VVGDAAQAMRDFDISDMSITPDEVLAGIVTEATSWCGRWQRAPRCRDTSLGDICSEVLVTATPMI